MKKTMVMSLFNPLIMANIVLDYYPSLPPNPVLPPSLPPMLPKTCETSSEDCSSLMEKNYFDVNCFTSNDTYYNLGCNAGGFRCCRFCEFGPYINISCIVSPNLPPNPPNLPTPPNFPSPLFPPKPCENKPNYCYRLQEKSYFDVNCESYNEIYSNMGCSAGGIKCCRFCEFGQYINIPCVKSPSPPPSPPSPRNPLIIPIDNIVLEPKKAKIDFHMRIESTIDLFNKNRFKRNILSRFNRFVRPEHIIINVRAGSLIVDITILTNISTTENTTDIIDTFTPTVLSEVLNVTVVELSPPTVENYIPPEESSNLNFNTNDAKKISQGEYLLYITITLTIITSLIWCYNKKNKKNKKNRKKKYIINQKELVLDGVVSLNIYRNAQNTNRDINSDEDTDNETEKKLEC